MNIIRTCLIPIVAFTAAIALAQSSALDTFNQLTKELGEHMSKWDVSLSDVGNVQILVEHSNPFRVPDGKLRNPILMRENELAFEPAVKAVYLPVETTGCGVFDGNNAAYCPPDNTIYHDPAFLAAVRKEVARLTKSTGDYGVLVVIAHELGHAIAFHRYADPRFGLGTTYASESYADCAAGALTADVQRAGIWPAGAERQGRAALALLSDKEFSPDGHGTMEDRVNNFNKGYQNGKGSLASCIFDGPIQRLGAFGNSR